MNYNAMSPYELGEARNKESLPHLIVYLNNGSDNEKRLAASGIIKLMQASVNCYSAIPFLVKNLKSLKPQVRQYTLKALREFKVPGAYYGDIIGICSNDEKDYNRILAEEVISQMGDNELINNYHPNSEHIEQFGQTVESEVVTSEKGFVYFIKEDYAGRIKIGKTKDINQRLDTFNVKLPFNVTLIHVIESNNYHYTEKLFHILFQLKRVNGEWFELNDGDINWIKSGQYTEKIMQSIHSTKTSPKQSKDRHVTATEKQISFLNALLENSQLMLIKPVSRLSATDAAALIGYLYKGEPLPKHLKSIIQSKRFYNSH